MMTARLLLCSRNMFDVLSAHTVYTRTTECQINANHKYFEDNKNSKFNKEGLCLVAPCVITTNKISAVHCATLNTPCQSYSFIEAHNLNVVQTMGCVNSRVDGVLDNPDGNKADFEERFAGVRELGEGSFGVVSLVNDKKGEGLLKQYACKSLKKGEVWKGDTLYPPIPPNVLRKEVEILRDLGGQRYCLHLLAVYETKEELLLVSECCFGGEMMEYVSTLTEDLRTEDISRISYQLLNAVDHCQKHNVIHRDLKPENIMFLTDQPNSELRLIDFGLSTNRVVDGVHTTYSGTPFYNSPEMFKNKYTFKTDVW